MSEKIFKRIYFLSLAVFLLALPILNIKAASLYLEENKINVVGSDEILIDLMVDTLDKSINAIKGEIKFDSQDLKINSIRVGNSIINFWVDTPKLGPDGPIKFAGIIPTGFTGKEGLVLQLVVAGQVKSDTKLNFQNLEIFLNDGLGTKESLPNISFDLKENMVSMNENPKSVDSLPPENFTPEIGRDQNIFENQWFVVFVTKDRGSTVQYYAIKEVPIPLLALFKKYKKVESPAILENQDLKSFILIKAVDESGNERVVTVDPANKTWWQRHYFYLFIFAVVIIMNTLFSYNKNKQKTQPNES